MTFDPSADASPLSSDFERYARQVMFPGIGSQGQRRLLASRVLVCGCGALGSTLADTLVRAGVGQVRIVDRDVVDLTNLQRQVLFDEEDVRSGLPKAIAAAEKLRRINSTVEIEPHVLDVDHTNIARLAADVDCIVDGTDNFELRFLINDLALSRGIPWVYGGCLGASGQTLTILPGETACLRCVMHDPPPPGSTPTCDTAGILAPAIGVIASLQAAEAIKILSGQPEQCSRTLQTIDLWSNQLRQIDVSTLWQQSDCPACQGREFPWLAGSRSPAAAALCGRNAVQLNPPDRTAVDLEQLAIKLAAVGKVHRNPFLLRLNVSNHQLTIFSDGRAIISGTDDIPTARTLYARYIGN